MLCGLLTPDSGCGSCLGYDILRQLDEIKRHVGYMTQRFSLYERSVDPREPRIAMAIAVARFRQTPD